MTTPNPRLGRCYELSAEYVIEHGDDLTLVHGTIQGAGLPPNPHAWVEWVDTELAEATARMLRVPVESAQEMSIVVHDPVMGWTVPREAYRALMGAEEFVRYTPAEAGAKMLETRMYGSWDARSDVAREAFLKAVNEKEAL